MNYEECKSLIDNVFTVDNCQTWECNPVPSFQHSIVDELWTGDFRLEIFPKSNCIHSPIKLLELVKKDVPGVSCYLDNREDTFCIKLF